LGVDSAHNRRRFCIVTFLPVKGLKVAVTDSIVGMENDICFLVKVDVIIAMLPFIFFKQVLV